MFVVWFVCGLYVTGSACCWTRICSVCCYLVCVLFVVCELSDERCYGYIDYIGFICTVIVFYIHGDAFDITWV